MKEYVAAVFLLVGFTMGFGCIAYAIKTDREIEMAKIVTNCVGKK